MKSTILKIVAQLKETLREIDENGASSELLDQIYEGLIQIEDEVYDDDLNNNDYNEEDY